MGVLRSTACHFLLPAKARKYIFRYIVLCPWIFRFKGYKCWGLTYSHGTTRFLQFDISISFQFFRPLKSAGWKYRPSILEFNHHCSCYLLLYRWCGVMRTSNGSYLDFHFSFFLWNLCFLFPPSMITQAHDSVFYCCWCCLSDTIDYFLHPDS